MTKNNIITQILSHNRCNLSAVSPLSLAMLVNLSMNCYVHVFKLKVDT